MLKIPVLNQMGISGTVLVTVAIRPPAPVEPRRRIYATLRKCIVPATVLERCGLLNNKKPLNAYAVLKN